MTKQDMKEVLDVLADKYPDGQFEPSEWWAMFRTHEKVHVLGGLREWTEGQYGYKAPTPLDIRNTSEVCIWNPDGIFYKAMMKAMEERSKKANENELQKV